VEPGIQAARVVRFATFEVDLRSGEVRKGGVKLKVSGQPFQVLAILLEQPGAVVTREELQEHLWPDLLRLRTSRRFQFPGNSLRSSQGQAGWRIVPCDIIQKPGRGYFKRYYVRRIDS